MEKERSLEEELQKAETLESLIRHDGWSIVAEIFQNYKSSLDTIKGINWKDKGLEEAMGRQLALELLEKWWDDLVGVVDAIPDLRKAIEKQNANGKPSLYRFHGSPGGPSK